MKIEFKEKPGTLINGDTYLVSEIVNVDVSGAAQYTDEHDVLVCDIVKNDIVLDGIISQVRRQFLPQAT